MLRVERLTIFPVGILLESSDQDFALFRVEETSGLKRGGRHGEVDNKSPGDGDGSAKEVTREWRKLNGVRVTRDRASRTEPSKGGPSWCDQDHNCICLRSWRRSVLDQYSWSLTISARADSHQWPSTKCLYKGPQLVAWRDH